MNKLFAIYAVGTNDVIEDMTYSNVMVKMISSDEVALKAAVAERARMIKDVTDNDEECDWEVRPINVGT